MRENESGSKGRATDRKSQNLSSKWGDSPGKTIKSQNGHDYHSLVARGAVNADLPHSSARVRGEEFASSVGTQIFKSSLHAITRDYSGMSLIFVTKKSAPKSRTVGVMLDQTIPRYHHVPLHFKLVCVSGLLRHVFFCVLLSSMMSFP